MINSASTLVYITCIWGAKNHRNDFYTFRRNKNFISIADRRIVTLSVG